MPRWTHVPRGPVRLLRLARGPRIRHARPQSAGQTSRHGDITCAIPPIAARDLSCVLVVAPASGVRRRARFSLLRPAIRALLAWVFDVPWLAQTMRPRIDEKLASVDLRGAATGRSTEPDDSLSCLR
jgi:hypothetical protein